MNRIFCTIIFAFTVSVSNAQTNIKHKMTHSEYVLKYKDVAISKMLEYHIPASITLAQGILESGSGGGRLSVQANNHFGIKCGSEWSGARIYHDDDAKGECFRKYNSSEESYNDHSKFLIGRDRYSKLFELDIMDYKAWAHGLKLAGYATNPKYAYLLIDLIESNELWRHDKEGVSSSLFGSSSKGSSSDTSSIKSNSTGVLTGVIGAFSNIRMRDNQRYKIMDNKNNSVRYYVIQQGDTFNIVSKKLRMRVRDLLKYNDLSCEIPLLVGNALYVERKKRKSKEVEIHRVELGETLHSISQQYGVQLKYLIKRNPQYGYTSSIEGVYLVLR